MVYKNSLVLGLTSETLFTDWCTGSDPKSASFCGNGKDLELRTQKAGIREGELIS